jgi:hypothetical protein
MHGPPSLPAAEAPAPESACARRRASFRRHTPRLLRAAQPWRSASHRLARPRARPLPRHCPPPLLRSAAPTCSASALRSFRCLSAPCQQSDFARPDLRPPVRSLARPNSLAPLRLARARPAPSAPPHLRSAPPRFSPLPRSPHPSGTPSLPPWDRSDRTAGVRPTRANRTVPPRADRPVPRLILRGGGGVVGPQATSALHAPADAMDTDGGGTSSGPAAAIPGL